MTSCTNILLLLHLYDPVISIIVTLTITVSWKNLNICDTEINRTVTENWGTWWHSWLRHCATSRKVAGSTPYGVIGIFR